MSIELLSPPQLSDELRNGTSPELTRRRIGIGLSLGGAFVAAAVAAYQTGLSKRLPDILPGKVWDAEKVDASDYAYSNLQQPDGPMMLVNYGLTAMAIAAGGKDRAEQNPALPVVAAAKAAGDFALCSAMAVKEWQENKKLCSWCQVATVISATTLAVSLPEAIKALRGPSSRPAH
ncbi:vitamin K epoxide reductase family protein [Sphingomonas sp. TREG-RG-20F-R18-01]|uniref:vitamin K epoxide reductase family protein n=1 Tax=Sphingomonas sp. TREG-RG-20F-R18-01 TaxID=2914982 RepID=UPI001F584635|nr:vitamin K epoxide reductase family protein [Sphingomonas sp. TREG-RG-20F-R18-01]